MPLLILYHFFSLLVFYLFYIVGLYAIYDLAPSLIDCPPNALVFDWTGFLERVQMHRRSERRVQVYPNVNVRELWLGRKRVMCLIQWLWISEPTLTLYLSNQPSKLAHSHPSPLPSVLIPSLSTLLSDWPVKAKQTWGHTQTQIGKSGRHSKGETFCWISLYFYLMNVFDCQFSNLK